MNKYNSLFQNDDDDNSFDISEPSIPAIPTTSEKGYKCYCMIVNFSPL